MRPTPEPFCLSMTSRRAASGLPACFSDEFSIVTAASVDEALHMLQERGTEVAVLVTDYRMPVRDGIDLLTVAQRECFRGNEISQPRDESEGDR